jgi:hypothetical protein
VDTPEQFEPLTVSLPGFAPTPSQLLDPPLPPVPAPEGSRPASPDDSLSDDPIPYVPTDRSTDDTGPRTTSSAGKRRWRPGGDPTQAAQIIGGLIVLVTGLAGTLAMRTGRRMRQPDAAQRDAIAEPLGRIAVRWLPMDAIGRDFLDGLQAARGAHDYLTAGPLITRPAADLTVEA